MIKVSDVSKKFDNHQVLQNVNCEFEQGKIYGIIGKNGEGKSTLLRIINGIYEPDSGSVLLDGEKIQDSDKLKQKMVFVSDDSYFFKGYTIKDMGEFYNSLYEKFDMKLLIELAKDLKLNMKEKISNFSKGMKRQTSLILALSTNSDYMFFDETFDGLDPINRNIMKNYIEKKAREDNKAFIMTSHNMKELQDICDIFGILYDKTLSFENDTKFDTDNVIKIQIAFKDKFDKKMFSDLKILNYEQSGNVAKIILKGNKDEILGKLQGLNPILLENLNLTLEEKLVYETEGNTDDK